MCCDWCAGVVMTLLHCVAMFGLGGVLELLVVCGLGFRVEYVV